MENDPRPPFRTFRVLVAFRRYSRVEAVYGGVFTLLERDPRGNAIKKFGALEKLLFKNVGGVYQLRGEHTRFYPQELDEHVQKGRLQELPAETFEEHKTKTPRR